jgi:glycosyltransferase involved in cell wall biosynthesis
MSGHYNVSAVSSDGDLLNVVKYVEGVNVIPINMTRKITPLTDLKSAWELYLLFKKEKPFIVHTHTPKAGTVGMLAAKIAGVPNRLHTVAGLPLLEVSGLKRKLLNCVEKITYSCATRVYPNSLGLRGIILENKFVNADKLKVIGLGSSNGIDTNHYTPDAFSLFDRIQLRNELGIGQNDFVFIFVGRLVGDKGINELVEAFISLTTKYANVRLLLLGDTETDLDPLTDQTLHEVLNNKSIISVGFQDDVRKFFFASDTLVFPSYREGFPNVVMQAGSMGLPCIVSNINGCNEIIIEGENGIIIPVKQVEPILQAMDKMYTNVEYRNELRTKARQLIVERYEQRFVWEAILKEYKSLEEDV